jgi:pimeloyl-ACP methyl ester carboxylesterase
VIRYDTRGWGRTETDDIEYSDADDAAAVLDQLGEGSAHVIDGYRAETAWGKPQPLDPPAVERLADAVAPTLVMIGELDEPSAVAAGRHLGATVANARLVSFPVVAHMIHLEDPDEFNKVTLEFLAEAGERGNT